MKRSPRSLILAPGAPARVVRRHTALLTVALAAGALVGGALTVGGRPADAANFATTKAGKGASEPAKAIKVAKAGEAVKAVKAVQVAKTGEAVKAVKVVKAKFSVDEPYAAPEFAELQNWVNSSPLTLASLKGKVVLINFWTFGCYNCQNTIPHVKDLYAKYHAKGFEIVGIHAPEFDYEKDAANVREAVADDGIAWPVAQDNGFKTWRRYKNGFWPAFYYLDRTGRVRHLHIGEGGYANQDAVVAALLAERNTA